MNMALDEILLHAVQTGKSLPVVRLYRWSTPTLSLGFSQRRVGQYNLQACRQQGVEVVRRLTGGRAVLHDDELTYAVIAECRDQFSGSISRSFEHIAQVLLTGLTYVGLNVRIATRHGLSANTHGVEQSACFTAPAQFEILCGDKKICGSSQKRIRQAFLQHGSLPLSMDLARLYAVLNTDNHQQSVEGIARLANKIGWINLFCVPPCTKEHLESALIDAFIRCWPVDFIEQPLTPAELHQAHTLALQRYSRVDWPIDSGDSHAG